MYVRPNDFEPEAYARWAFGAGRAHVFADAAGAASPLIGALATLPLTDPGKLAGTPDVLVPTLWRDYKPEAGAMHLPLLLRLPAAGGNASLRPLDDVAEAARQFSDTAELRLGAPVLESRVDADFATSRIDKRLNDAAPGRRPKAIIAVIDDGLPFAHRNFRDRDGRTRIAFCWRQGAPVAPEEADRTVLFGHELLGGDIDELVAASGADETGLYRRLSHERGAFAGDMTLGAMTHGSHVLDAAGGYRHKGDGTAGNDLDDAAIIAVQLPMPVTLDTTAFGHEFSILSALQYIFDRAERLARRHGVAELPLVINLSYGFSGGPHDGSDQLERAIRALVSQRKLKAPTHLVMPAGNDFESSLLGVISAEMLAARGSNPAQGFAIPWRIQPVDRTSNYLEIWLPPGADPTGVNFALRDPAGALIVERRLAAADGTRHIDLVGDASAPPFGQVSIERIGNGGPTRRWRIVVALAPTAREFPSRSYARSGRWSVELSELAAVLAKGPIACRIQRDINPFGYANGARQSYLDEPACETALPDLDEPDAGAFIQRFGTVNGIATHDAVTVVGGYIVSTQCPAPYSSAGETSAGTTARVHCSAPSELNPALPGILGAGVLSGSVFRMQGTSTASPQVARAIAAHYLRAGGSRHSPGGLADLLGERWRPADDIAIPHYDERHRQARLGNGLLAERGSGHGPRES